MSGESVWRLRWNVKARLENGVIYYFCVTQREITKEAFKIKNETGKRPPIVPLGDGATRLALKTYREKHPFGPSVVWMDAKPL